MENVPEKIYLDLGSNCPNDCDFNELSQVTWSQDNATGNGIEFTRSDIAEQMAKEFGQHCWDNMWTQRSLNELFEVFINCRNDGNTK